MRIAHVTDFYLPRLGGIEMHVSDLVARQQARGHDVTVVTAAPGDGVVDLPGVRVVRVTEAFRRPRAIHHRAPFAAARQVLEGSFDVVHVHVAVGTPTGFWVALAAVRAGIPTVVTVHSLWAWAHPIFRTLDTLAGFSRTPIRWTAVSEAAAAQVRRVVRTAGAVSVLPNGIDPQHWAVDPVPRAADEVVLAAVMRLAVRKRPLPFLRMLREVRRRVPAGIALSAVLVGEGPNRPRLEAYLRRHGMAGWVSLPGRQDREQIRELYRRADLFVAPADLESFGIAALEARCAGVPVVAKAGNGISEFVAHDRDGLLVADDAGMVDALVALCCDPARRAALAGHAGAKPSPVTWDTTLALTERAYHEAAVLVGRPLERPLAAAG